MSRQPVTMRQATNGDVPFLVELWSDQLRRADRQDQVHDLEMIVKEAAESAERRLLVAEYDGDPAGAVLLRVVTMTPLNLEPTVQAIAPHVTPSYRGKGIGSALMEAAVQWADDLGIAHIASAAPSGSRTGNRFMARLSLGPQATLRASSTSLVRAKLAALQPPTARVQDRIASRRHLGQVLAVRRQLSRRTSGDSGAS
jgi:GNAT superfamily N-acetyltransferase